MATVEFRTGADLGVVNLIFLGLTLVLAGIHAYLGVVALGASDARGTQFLIIGAAFLAGAIAYVTPLWRPMFYLLGVAFALYLGLVWMISGMAFFVVGVLTGLVATVFVVLALYLFVHEGGPLAET